MPPVCRQHCDLTHFFVAELGPRLNPGNELVIKHMRVWPMAQVMHQPRDSHSYTITTFNVQFWLCCLQFLYKLR